MIEGQFQLPIWYDLIATFAFAITGAMVGIHKKYDVVGVVALAIAVGVGGGVIRDGVFLNQTPAMATDWRYLAAVLIAVIFTLILHDKLSKRWFIVGFFDALGLAAYTVVGTQKSLFAGMTLVAAILVGVINATGGGILRDVLAGERPPIFQPSQLYVIISILGGAGFLTLTLFVGLSAQTAAIGIIGVMVASRVLVMLFDIKTLPATELPKPRTIRIKK